MSSIDVSAASAYSGVTSYQKWIESEGIPVVRGYFVENLRTLELAPWPRKEGKGAFICLEGAAESCDAYVCEIAPGKNLAPQRHLFEELIYVLSGRGATTVWQEGGVKRTFEWQAGSVFSPPLNTWHRHFNGSGEQPARYLAVTLAPPVFNLFHNADFVFQTPFNFSDRYREEEDFFSGKGETRLNRVWDTNFVADVKNFQLREWQERGAGGKNIMFELCGNSMSAHISEFPVGTYKKAHRHGPGAHVVILAGEGYSLLWPEGQEIKRIDWKEDSLLVPPDMWLHQHFNAGAAPARYLALKPRGQKFRQSPGYVFTGSAVSVKEGGNQIEYEDEDPEILRQYTAACAKAGVRVQMEKFFRKKD